MKEYDREVNELGHRLLKHLGQSSVFKMKDDMVHIWVGELIHLGYVKHDFFKHSIDIQYLTIVEDLAKNVFNRNYTIKPVGIC